jgi:hypothetical protein
VFIISAMNTICASSYMLLQHITPDQWMVTVAHFTWQVLFLVRDLKTFPLIQVPHPWSQTGQCIFEENDFMFAGFPPVIYLCLNRTIRNDCRQLLARIISGIGGNNRVQDATNAITNVTNPNASSKKPHTTPAK